MRRLRQDVPKANVILVNPTHVAVALRYDAKTMEAPVLLAKGADHMAQRIMKIGRSYGIPIVQRPEIARAIYASRQAGPADSRRPVHGGRRSARDDLPPPPETKVSK